MSEPSPVLVVLTPELIGRACFDRSVIPLLQLWRDGRIRPVVSQSLLARYFRLFHQLGLAERQIRRWGWWFTSNRKTTVCEEEAPELGTIELCDTVARLGEAKWIIHGGVSKKSESKPSPALDPVPWVSVAGFMKKAGSPGQIKNRQP